MELHRKIMTHIEESLHLENKIITMSKIESIHSVVHKCLQKLYKITCPATKDRQLCRN